MNGIRVATIKRYWLPFVVSMFCFLVITVDNQEYVLAQVPTPDVNTVPDLQDLYTRTPTATAVPVVIVTATPAAQETETGSETAPAINAPADNEDAQEPTNTNPSAVATTTTVAVPEIISESTAGTARNTAPSRIGIVNTESLNVREAPNATSTIIDQLVRNTQVTLLQQDENLRWWYICCGSTNNLQGWVNADYLTLAPLSSAGLPDQNAEAVIQPPLQIQLLPKQHFVWQGQPLTIQVVVTNPKTVSIRQVTIRTDLPPEVNFVTATTNLAGSQQVENQVTEHTIVTLAWPEIAAQTQVVTTLNLQIATEVANGSQIDLIAAVDAVGEPTIVAGIAIIMPPKRLPIFR